MGGIKELSMKSELDNTYDRNFCFPKQNINLYAGVDFEKEKEKRNVEAISENEIIKVMNHRLFSRRIMRR